MSNEKKGIDPNTLVVATLGLLGTIAAALIGVYGRGSSSNSPTPVPPTPIVIVATATNPVPTDTVPVGADTSTPAPTDTPAPTFTFTALPPVALGEDWGQGCISSLWSLYPPSDIAQENGCLKAPVDQFFVKAGKLAYGFSVNVPSAELHGLFAKLPSSGKLTLNMTLNEIATGEIVIGILSAPTIDANTNGALLVIPETNTPDKAKMLFKSMPGQKLFSQSQGPVDSQNGVYDVLFDFNSGEVSVKLKSGQVNLGTIPALSADKWLFIGYQVFIGGNRLNAEFSNLVIVP